MNRVRQLSVSRKFKEALAEYAYLKRTTMGAVVRAAIDDVKRDPLDDSVLSENTVPGGVNLNVKVYDDVWATTRDAARDAGRSFYPLITRRILKMLEDEGLM